MSATHGKVTVLGSFVVDLAFRTPHLPVAGETITGSSFATGPGGKGCNQGVAALATVPSPSPTSPRL